MSEIDWTKLREPFPSKDVEWRVQASGSSNGNIWARVLAYITNRAIQDRLDSVVGVENWRNEYQKAPDGGVMCGLSIRIGGEWVTKWDGAENTDIEGVKGGLSGAMKRAGVQWGIGRYLYALEAYYANVSPSGANYAQTKDKTPFKWDPPSLPAWALPAGEQPKPPAAPPKKPDTITPEEMTALKQALIDHIAAGNFEHPDNVQAVMDANAVGRMRAALEAAKANEARRLANG